MILEPGNFKHLGISGEALAMSQYNTRIDWGIGSMQKRWVREQGCRDWEGVNLVYLFLFYFISQMCLFISKFEKRGYRKRDLQPTGSLHKRSQWLRLGQAKPGAKDAK